MSLKRYTGLLISIFRIGVLSTPYMAPSVLAAPLAVVNRAEAKDIEGGVAFYYRMNDMDGDACSISFMKGASYGWDDFDHAYYEMPYPADAHTLAIGSIEGREAYSLVFPPLQDVVGSSHSENFSGSIVVNEGKSVTLENASHYLTWSISGLEDCDVTINGVNARTDNRLDFENLTGTFGQGEHPTASWNIYVEYVPRPKAPAVETLVATEVTFTTATVHGQITNNTSPREYWFTYWTQGGSFYSTDRHCCVSGDDTFSDTISGLKPDTKYFYEAHAEGVSDTGMVQTFTTPGLRPADLSQNAPHVLRIESIHDRDGWTRTVDLIYQYGATEGPMDSQDSKYVIYTGIYWELLSRVGSSYLKKDARPPASTTPFHIEQGYFSAAYQGQVNGGAGITNALRVSLPPESKGTFGSRLLTFQEYIPSAADPDVPEPNAQTFPIYDLRALMADGNGVGTIPLPALPRRPYVGPIHWFVLRTDRVSLADFNGDRVVDANDYAVVLRDLGKVGNSMGDIASMKGAKLVIGIPDGKVDGNDVAAFQQELARYQALVAAVYGPQGAPGDEAPATPNTPGGSSSPSTEGFEGSLGSEWSASGGAPWQITSAVAHAGNQCIRAGTIGDDQTSELLLGRDCKKGSIRFWRKTSSERFCDSYRFFINGVEQEEVSGETDWQQVSFPITGVGKNYFLWSYRKDISSSYGADTVWIDDVEILAE